MTATTGGGPLSDLLAGMGLAGVLVGGVARAFVAGAGTVGKDVATVGKAATTTGASMTAGLAMGLGATAAASGVGVRHHQ